MGSVASVCQAVSYGVKHQRSMREMVSAFSSFNIIALCCSQGPKFLSIITNENGCLI